MIQQIQLYAFDSNGQRWELDLYEEEPIKLTISAEDIEDIPKIDSTYSRLFRVPGTGNNSKIFKWWYEIGVIDFDATVKVEAEIVVDGLLFKKGHLRINAAYINNDTNNIDLELVFFGAVRNFSTQIGEGFMTELDLSDTNHVLDEYAIYNSWNQWTGGPFLDGKIRYCLAERGYFYEDTGTGQNTVKLKTTPAFPGDNNYTTGEISYQRTDLSFTDIAYPIRKEQYTPLIQVKYLVDKIFEKTDYTYSDRSIFSELSSYWPVYRNLYIDGISENTPLVTSVPSSLALTTGQSYTADSIGYWERVKFFNVVTDPSNAWQTTQFEWIVPYDASTYLLQSEIEVSFSNDIGSTARIDVRMQRESGGVTTTLFSNYTTYAGGGYITTAIGLNTVGTPVTSTLNAGDKIWIEIKSQDVFREPIIESTSYFEQTAGPSFVAVNNLMKVDLKIIDFLRSLLTKARLVMVPTKADEQVFDIIPWSDYIGTGDEFDWSDKLDDQMDVVLKPLFFDQSQSINFEDPEGNDYNNIDHQLTYNYTFGRLLYDSHNDILTDQREITTVFAPTPVSRLDDAPETSRFIIPKLAQYEYDGAKVKPTGTGNQPEFLQAKSILPKPRLLFWNGLQTVASGEEWYDEFEAAVPGATGINVYPVVSYFSEPSYFFNFPNTVNPNADQSINLNWNREFNAGFDDNGTPAFNSLNGESVYEHFWADYIESLYSPRARFLTAYFRINALDLKELSFDDSIFIKDSWWRVYKVYDAPLTDIAVVKVELIKLLTYVPQAESGTPTGLSDWNLGDEAYGNGIGNWEGNNQP